MADKDSELYSHHLAHNQRYTYFLLAAVGACLGFSLTQTQGLGLSWTQIPLGVAIVVWGLSIWYGCRCIERTSLTLYANYALVQVQTGTHPDISGYGREAQVHAADGIRLAAERHSDLSNRFGRRQFRLFIFGVLCYIVWHVWEMWSRT